MNDLHHLQKPPAWSAIFQDSVSAGFSMASDPLTGSWLRTLAASKTNGRFLELGTGTGLSTAWILDGMSATASLVSVDNDPAVTEIAQKHLGHDSRLTLRTMDGAEFLQENCGHQFDYIFADTWAGKYNHLQLALDMVKVGGFYIIDDMLPQANWPAEHAEKARDLLEKLESLDNFQKTKMSWATGLVLMVRVKE